MQYLIISFAIKMCDGTKKCSIHVSIYAKFRCGVAPINIELLRYGLARIPVEERFCSHCNEVKEESHVLMYCPLYDDIRD